MRQKLNPDIRISQGIVLNVDEHNYTSTGVHTSGPVNAPVVHSTTTHHQKQRIWYQEENGAESSVTLDNCDVSVRETQRIAVIANKKKGQVLRFVNLTTGYYWRIAQGTSYPKGFFSGVWHFIIRNTLAAAGALLSILPVVNILVGLCMLFGLFIKGPLPKAYRSGKLFSFLFIGVLLVVYAPHYPHHFSFAPVPPKFISLDNDTTISLLARIIHIKEKSQKTEVLSVEEIEEKLKKIRETEPERFQVELYSYDNKGKLEYPSVWFAFFSFFLFLIAFWKYSHYFKRKSKVSKALDEICLELMRGERETR